MAFLKFAVGDKKVLRLKFDTPKEKEWDDGKKSYNYSVEVFDDSGTEIPSGDEYGWTWGASQAAHDTVSDAGLKAGDEVAAWRKEEKKYSSHISRMFQQLLTL